MRLLVDTGIERVKLEIEGEVFDVSPKTVKTSALVSEAMELIKSGHARDGWIKGTQALLGDVAVAKLFIKGDDENLDRMEIIFLAALNAFDRAARDAREKRLAIVDSELAQLRSRLEIINRTVDDVLGKFATIRRDKTT